MNTTLRTHASASLSRPSRSRSGKQRCLAIISAAICWIASAPLARAIVLVPGDLISSFDTQVWKVDPATGQHQVFADASATNTFFSDLASTPNGSIDVVTNQPVGTQSNFGLSSLDPASGIVTPIASGFGNNALSSINLGSSGTIYALQNALVAPVFQPNSLLAINPTTGMASTVFNNTATTGPTPGINVGSLSLLPGGLAAFIGLGSSLTGNGGVYTYNFATGSATLLVQGGPLTAVPPGFLGTATPDAIATLPNGKLLVTSDYNCGTECFNAFEIDPTTGAVTQVGSGLLGQISKIAVAPDGTIYLAGGLPRLGGFIDQFNLANGTTTSILQGLSGGQAFPAVFAPEPTSGALTVFGISILTLVRRCARKAQP